MADVTRAEYTANLHAQGEMRIPKPALPGEHRCPVYPVVMEVDNGDEVRFIVSCVCDFTVGPFTDIHLAFSAAWLHEHAEEDGRVQKWRAEDVRFSKRRRLRVEEDEG